MWVDPRDGWDQKSFHFTIFHLRLNPDGVAAGRTRTNLDSVDLNRQNVCTKWGMSEAMLKNSDFCLG